MKLRIRYKKLKQENERLRRENWRGYKKPLDVTENRATVVKVISTQLNPFPDFQENWLKHEIACNMTQEILPLIKFEECYDIWGKKAMQGTLEVLDYSKEA